MNLSIKTCMAGILLGAGIFSASLPALAQEQQPAVPEVKIGDLVFKATSLRVSFEPRPRLVGGGGSDGTLTLTVENRGTVPVALNYQDGSASLVNETGQTWKQHFDTPVVGVGMETNRSASLNYIVDPGGELAITVKTYRSFQDQSGNVGTSFNFQAVFSSFKEAGGGKLEKIRSYPVSFRGLKKATAMESGALDVKDSVQTIETDIKNTLGRIFGK